MKLAGLRSCERILREETKCRTYNCKPTETGMFYDPLGAPCVSRSTLVEARFKCKYANLFTRPYKCAQLFFQRLNLTEHLTSVASKVFYARDTPLA
jgi:hypothetical protein